MNLKETSDGLCVGRKLPAHQCMHVCIQSTMQLTPGAIQRRTIPVFTLYSMSSHRYLYTLRLKDHMRHSTEIQKIHTQANELYNCACVIINHPCGSRSIYGVSIRTKVVKGVGFIYFLKQPSCLRRRGRLSLK